MIVILLLKCKRCSLCRVLFSIHSRPFFEKADREGADAADREGANAADGEGADAADREGASAADGEGAGTSAGGRAGAAAEKSKSVPGQMLSGGARSWPERGTAYNKDAIAWK